MIPTLLLVLLPLVLRSAARRRRRDACAPREEAVPTEHRIIVVGVVEGELLFLSSLFRFEKKASEFCQPALLIFFHSFALAAKKKKKKKKNAALPPLPELCLRGPGLRPFSGRPASARASTSRRELELRRKGKFRFWVGSAVERERGLRKRRGEGSRGRERNINGEKKTETNLPSLASSPLLSLRLSETRSSPSSRR